MAMWIRETNLSQLSFTDIAYDRTKTKGTQGIRDRNVLRQDTYGYRLGYNGNAYVFTNIKHMSDILIEEMEDSTN